MSNKGKIFYGGIAYYLMVEETKCRRLPSLESTRARFREGEESHHNLGSTGITIEEYLEQPGAYLPAWAKPFFFSVKRRKVTERLP